MSRWIAVAAGEGALAGWLGGSFLGVWHSSLHRDLALGTHLLLAFRLESFAWPALLGGVVLSLILLCAGAVVSRHRSAASARWVLALAPLAATIAVLSIGPWRSALGSLLRPPGTPAFATWVSAAPLALAAVAIVGLRIHGVGRLHGAGTTRSPRRRWGLATTGVLAAALTAAAHLGLPHLAARRAQGHPSVVLISIDTLRADRLAAAGYPRSVTPHLDQLAREGALFLQATSTSPWTFPAHVSLFTADLPFDHGGRIWRARPGFLMLAEIFRDAGYRTAAHTGGTWVDSAIGFAQGFESFTSHDELQEGGPEAYLAEAADWIQSLDGDPFFLFLHTYEAHTPYVHADFADRADAGHVGASFDFSDLERLRTGDVVLDERERRYVIDLYDGDVAAVDRFIGAFLTRLDGIRPRDDTIVVVVSDHGEDLWDHVDHRSGDHGHSLYEELLRVPWILRKTGDVPAGLRFRRPVSLVDVAPTLLDLAGLAPPPHHAGRSLLGSLRHGIEPRPRPVFAEMVEYGPDRFSVRSGPLKVIVTPTPDTVHQDVHLAVDSLEVFDLVQDPHERHGLALEDDAAWNSLAEIVSRRAAICLGLGPPMSPPPLLPEETLAQMRALGYTN